MNNPPVDLFVSRHLGPRDADITRMLEFMGCASLDDLSDRVVPEAIRSSAPLALGEPQTEGATLERLREVAGRNRTARSYVGLGYYGTITPPVILRNVLENPGWYTQYTPYQAEIAQGRLEALLNFQTMVADLTGMPMANASLLDEATAAAEAMSMCRRLSRSKSQAFFAADDCHPQTLSVLRTRAEPLGIELVVGSAAQAKFDDDAYFGLLLQSPSTDGRIYDYSDLVVRAHDGNCLVVVATDLLALTLLRSPGEQGADIAIGSTQRFGMPMGYGGPHAAFIAASERAERQLPGRIVGVSKDADGEPALRLARQTREQHIRREKATSNICTAQVLPAVVASMYAVYHGPEGLRAIGERVHRQSCRLAAAVRSLGYELTETVFFDTLKLALTPDEASELVARAAAAGMNLRQFADGGIGVSCDQTVEEIDLDRLLAVLAEGRGEAPRIASFDEVSSPLSAADLRQDSYLTHAVFHAHRSEHEMLRYLNELQEKDLSLTHSMIPLGSCTMKLNATAEMMPISWPELAHVHPFAPDDQTAGYRQMFEDLEQWLAEITGFSAVSLQPNAGSQGEFAGLLAIRGYHDSRGDTARTVCLIPTSAHGTNPASAVMAGMKVVPIRCRPEDGSIDLDDLAAKAEAHAAELAALMVTYPSTHGVFDQEIAEVCEIVHAHGGRVYMDGANMNAQVGLCRPGDIGADVCHLNLHKTFCIPHGGGGPGMGPICVNDALAPFLPRHPLEAGGSGVGGSGVGAIASSSHGSGLILSISWMFIALMGASGLRKASQVAILNANYMARRLSKQYDVLFTGEGGWVAHEFILDLRGFKETSGITVDDIAKRLIDYGFHAPTMSWPVAGTMMVEPTESESLAELDRFCDAMIAIREEIREIENGSADREDNVLRCAPHTAHALVAEPWPHAYSRNKAVFPAPWVRRRKFWPAVGRVDNAWGDRNLVCTCGSVEEFAEESLA